jgi:hypothetical protein
VLIVLTLGIVWLRRGPDTDGVCLLCLNVEVEGNGKRCMGMGCLCPCLLVVPQGINSLHPACLLGNVFLDGNGRQVGRPSFSV